MKIIYISKYSSISASYIPKIDDDLYAVASWGGLFARRYIKKYPGSDIEAWRISFDTKKIIEKNVFGIHGVIFPYKKITMGNTFTFDMLKRLHGLKDHAKIILHLQSVFNKFPIIKYVLSPNIKLVLSHHGGIPPDLNNFKSKVLRQISKNVSAITYLSPDTRDYYLNLGFPDNKLFFLPVGANFEFYKPMCKIEARKKLKLDLNKTYALYVGSFYKLKNVDLILDCYYRYKEKYNFEIIFIGGENNKENDLYNEVINSGALFKNRIEHKELINYYNASDFYIHPVFNPEFGGIDVSWMEALACNKPVISPKLSYLDFDYSELGMCPVDYNDFTGKMIFMIANHQNFTKCRDSSQHHLDGNTAIMKKLWSIYNEL